MGLLVVKKSSEGICILIVVDLQLNPGEAFIQLKGLAVFVQGFILGVEKERMGLTQELVDPFIPFDSPARMGADGDVGNPLIFFGALFLLVLFVPLIGPLPFLPLLAELLKSLCQFLQLLVHQVIDGSPRV